MDLYKWSYKLSPLVPSELVADCFALAREIRELDMRASPYDLAELGYEPVAVETPAGRPEYARAAARVRGRGGGSAGPAGRGLRWPCSHWARLRPGDRQRARRPARAPTR